MSAPTWSRLPIVALAAFVMASAWTSVAEAQQRRTVAKRNKVAVAPLQRNLTLAAQVDTPAVLPVTVSPEDGESVTLRLTRSRFTEPSAAQIDPSVPAVWERLCYNGAPTGPTIRVKRGQKFGILVDNALHGPIDPGPDPLDKGEPWEVPHGLCTTNLHVHGLHVSPSGNSDNVYLHFDPGTQFQFYYQLPPDHVAGTFWYHPHKHGGVAYQLSNGVAGALIIEGVPGDGIFDLDDIPQIAAAKEQILILQLYTFSTFTDGSGATVGFIDPAAIYNVNPRNNLFPCQGILPSGTVNTASGSEVLAVNGQLIPRFNAAPGEIQRWRFVDGMWDVTQYLAWYDANGNPVLNNEILMYEIALDGIPTGKLNQVSPMTIAPGQRDDLLVQFNKAGTYYLMRLDYNGDVGGVGSGPFIAVAKMVVQGTPRNMALPALSDLAKCVRFAPIANKELVTPTLPMGAAVFSQNDPANPPDLSDARYTINNTTFEQFLQGPPVRLTLGTAQEWRIAAVLNANNDPTFGGHPFHIHVNPFQIMSFTDSNGKTTMFKDTIFRDTLFIPDNASYTIRSRYQDLTGLSVFHCHILDHEDQGMMVPIKLVQPGDANNGGIDPSSLLAQADYPAPALTLPDAHGTPVDLKQFKGRNVVLVFFKGVRCAFCVADLRAMLREARTRVGQDVEIVAVSARKVDDLPKALAVLGVTETDRFHLLVDENAASFRDFGCSTGADTRHGLFLVDGSGKVRSRYIGETPYGDSEEVFDRIQLIASMPRPGARIAAGTTPQPARQGIAISSDPVGPPTPAAPAGLAGGGSED
jgi:FtsP/CotA-like multicopper oxidase with cupredoxin domain/peroxiredoxin